MTTLSGLIQGLSSGNQFDLIMRNALAQYGAGKRRYIGAELLPEKLKGGNTYTEEMIRFRTVVASAGSRYGAAQQKGGDLVGSLRVDLGHSDIKRNIDSQLYDWLVKGVMGGANTMEQEAAVLGWVDTVILTALLEHNERERWQAIVNSSVVRVGDNGFKETVNLKSPAGHRTVQAADWSIAATDIYGEISDKVQLLANKGYAVGRIVTSRQVVGHMAKNDSIKSRVGITTVSSGTVNTAVGRASLENINLMLRDDGLPPIELYDLQYRTETGTVPFLPAGSFVMTATTDREPSFDQGDLDDVVDWAGTLGYMAVGRPAGQAEAGRAVHVQAHTNKPPRIEAEGWQTSFPVIQEPEAIACITGIQ